MISKNALDPAPPEGTTDWVYVGRLVGRLPGPITRDATRMELAAAVGSGMSFNELTPVLHRSIRYLRDRLGLQ